MGMVNVRRGINREQGEQWSYFQSWCGDLLVKMPGNGLHGSRSHYTKLLLSIM